MIAATCLKSHGLVLLLTISGCGVSNVAVSGGGVSSEGISSEGEPAITVSGPSGGTDVSAAQAENAAVNSTAGVSDAILDLARADLASRLGVEPSHIDVAGRETVQWRNGSAGCPKPGMMYTQMLIPGYRIELRYNGESFWYHGRKGSEPFYCEHPEPPVSGSSDYATE